MPETLRAPCKRASIMRSHHNACALEHWPFHDAKTQSSNFFEPSWYQLVIPTRFPGHCCRVCSLPSGPARCSRPTLFLFHLHVVLLPARGCVAYAAAEIPVEQAIYPGRKKQSAPASFVGPSSGASLPKRHPQEEAVHAPSFCDGSGKGKNSSRVPLRSLHGPHLVTSDGRSKLTM